MGKTNTFSQIKRKTPKLKSTFNALFHWGNRAKGEKKRDENNLNNFRGF